MHICFIEDTHLHGGTQIWVSEAIRAFLGRGESVTLLAPQGSWIVAQCADVKARTFIYDWDGVVSQGAQSAYTWTAALTGCDAAICTVHPPRGGFHPSVFAARCIKQGELKAHLFSKTGTIVPEYLREFYLPDESIGTSIIAIADFTRKYLIDVYKIPPEKIALIYQGTDVRRFTPSEAGRDESYRRYRIPENAAPVLGSVGSLEGRKGHLVLFEALSRLVSAPLPSAHLIVVGDGPDEGSLRAKARSMGLESHVSFFPFTSQPELVFERIDITVLPSLYKEGLPNVLLESMSMGVPVVSSNLGGAPEIVKDGETGTLVEPGNSAQLAAGISQLWADQAAYQRMGRNARALMAERFDKEIQFDRFLGTLYARTGAGGSPLNR